MPAVAAVRQTREAYPLGAAAFRPRKKPLIETSAQIIPYDDGYREEDDPVLTAPLTEEHRQEVQKSLERSLQQGYIRFDGDQLVIVKEKFYPWGEPICN
jgi:hypothetical protein